MTTTDARKRHTENTTPKENPMAGPFTNQTTWTDDLRAIREEAVTASDLLVAILDLLEERLPSNPGAVSGPEGDAHAEQVPDTGDVTEEPPVGSQVTDRDGDVWERHEDGWHLIARDGKPYRGVGGRDWWAAIRRDHGPLRPTTDEDRERVGLPVDASNGQTNDQINTDPDEALAHALFDANEEFEAKNPKHAPLDPFRNLARVARERIARNHWKEHQGTIERLSAERDHALQWRREQTARAEQAEAERDELRDACNSWQSVAQEAEYLSEKFRDERDKYADKAERWAARHAALREDVAACRNACQIEDILARDDERGQS